jgi:hypothetical protein
MSTFRMPSQQIFSNRASQARSVASAGPHTPGFDIFTRPRPIRDVNLRSAPPVVGRYPESGFVPAETGRSSERFVPHEPAAVVFRTRNTRFRAYPGQIWTNLSTVKVR